MKRILTLVKRITGPKAAHMLFAVLLTLGVAVTAGCDDALTAAEDASPNPGAEATGLAGESITPDSLTAAQGMLSLEGPVIAIAGCGDGVPGDSELCFDAPTKVTNIAGELGGLAVGHINGGANLDFAVGAVTLDRIRIKYGSGTGTFPGTHTWSMGDGPTDVEIGDFNGDGRTDVIATNVHQDRVRIRWGHTNLKNWSYWSTGDNPWQVAVGDLDGDGRDDFATTNTLSDNLTVRLRKASGGFTSAAYAAGDGANDVQLGDCDNDGDLDLFYPSGLHGNAVIKVRRNRGNGTFGAPATIDMNSGSGDFFHSLTLGDYNKDGQLDLVAARNSHALVRVLGRSGCQFGTPVVASVPNNPYRIYTNDFDQDNHQDLVVAHVLAGRLTIYLGKGDGNFAGPYTYDEKFGVSGHTSDVGAGDFDGDGAPDLVYNGIGGVYLIASNP